MFRKTLGSFLIQAFGALASLVFLMTSGAAQAELRWVAQNDPAAAIRGGIEGGSEFFVCRANIPFGSQTVFGIGKTAAGWTTCNIGWVGHEQRVSSFEKLVGDQFQWVADKNQGYPANSVIGGHAGDGRRWIVCSAAQDDQLHPGYIADGDCIYGYRGEQKSSDHYLVLQTLNPAVVHEPGSQNAKDGGSPIGIILGLAGVAAFCAFTAGSCVAAAF